MMGLTEDLLMIEHHEEKVDVEDDLCHTEAEEVSYQVAGHKKNGQGLLKHKSQKGCILKIVQEGLLGKRELGFYQSVESEKEEDEDSALLKTLIAEFYGVACITKREPGDENATKTEYLILQDLARDWELPCIMDIKMGKQTWDPDATEEKILREKAKFPGIKAPLGLTFEGLQYYDIEGEEPVLVPLAKAAGKKMEVKDLYETLQKFLNKEFGAETIIAKEILKKLQPFIHFFDVQRKRQFFSSSLLIAYDANFVRKNLVGENKIVDPEIIADTDWVRLIMVDFAHTFSSGGQRDKNYSFALNSIKRLFTSLADGDPEFEA